MSSSALRQHAAELGVEANMAKSVGVVVVPVLLFVGFWGAVAWVVVHFLAKWW